MNPITQGCASYIRANDETLIFTGRYRAKLFSKLSKIKGVETNCREDDELPLEVQTTHYWVKR